MEYVPGLTRNYSLPGFHEEFITELTDYQKLVIRTTELEA